jgi:hypothetical protein
MLTGIINEDRHHLSLVQRHGWQGTEEGRHTGDIADRRYACPLPSPANRAAAPATDDDDLR